MRVSVGEAAIAANDVELAHSHPWDVEKFRPYLTPT
nr:MAG TPA: hypothetical protein [Caudoviricetes sp.]